MADKKGVKKLSNSSGLIDNESMYFYKLITENNLTILFGWFREKKKVGLFIIRDFESEDQETIYDSQEDPFLQKGKHRKSLPAVQIRYLEDTIDEILGTEYKPPINIGYDIYLMILNEQITERRDGRKRSN